MSDQFIDVDTDEFIDAPKALRDAYKQLKGRFTEVASERDTYRSQATSAALGGALKEFKNPERVKRDLLGDKVDPLDSQAVAAWLESNGSDYAKGDGSTTSTSRVDDPDAAAQRQIAGADLTTPADMTKLEAALAELGPNATGAEIKAVYAKHGV